MDADGSATVELVSGTKKLFNCSSKSAKYPDVSWAGAAAGITKFSTGTTLASAAITYLNKKNITIR